MYYFRIDDELELRPLEQACAESLFGLVDENREHLRQWLPWVDANQSVEATRAFIQSTRQRWATEHGLEVGIWFNQRLVGVVGFHAIDRANRSAEIGYWLSAAQQGQGVMSRACRALVNHGFANLDLNRIEIRVATGNAKSRAIPERLGFRQEGVLREAQWLYDHYVDFVVYAKLASEWTA